MEVAGRDLITGVPQQKEISVNLVRAAVKEPLAACIREIDLLLERTPPEVRKSIEMNGLCYRRARSYERTCRIHRRKNRY